MVVDVCRIFCMWLWKMAKDDAEFCYIICVCLADERWDFACGYVRKFVFFKKRKDCRTLHDILHVSLED